MNVAKLSLGALALMTTLGITATEVTLSAPRVSNLRSSQVA